MIPKKRNILRKKRIMRTRLKITGTPECPRLAVYRSNRHIYAQIIDDIKATTIASASTLSPDIRGRIAGLKKSEQASLVGEEIAKKAKEAGIEAVVFDRHGWIYTGRIAALAEGARKGGLKL